MHKDPNFQKEEKEIYIQWFHKKTNKDHTFQNNNRWRKQKETNFSIRKNFAIGSLQRLEFSQVTVDYNRPQKKIFKFPGNSKSSKGSNFTAICMYPKTKREGDRE